MPAARTQDRHEQDTRLAIAYLRNARDLLSASPRSAAKVRNALSSALGALRHVESQRFNPRNKETQPCQ